VNPRDVTGVVLAGGRGRRMGGRDKGLLPLRGRPLAAHALDALRPQVGALVVVANRNRARYAALGAAVVADAWPGYAGPLAGVHAGLRAATTDWALFVPCDAAWLPANLGVRLHAAAAAAGAAYATACGDALYTCCLLPRHHEAAAAAALRVRQLALGRFLRAQGAVPVEFADWPAAGRNLNAPADWREVAA
jgi:molybdenum cofactor guanylyltransferase